MFYNRKDAGKDIAYGKFFNNDGSIIEGEMDLLGTLTTGYIWELQDDKSHNKFKYPTDEFISNEKIY
jgi:hypothetical protein